MPPPSHPRTPADRIATLFASALGDAARHDAAGNEAADQERGDPGVCAAETLYDRTSRGLARWFGAYGTHSLVTRALLRTQIDHPALRSLTLGPRGDDDATAPLGLLGVQEGARAHGHEAVAAALLALLTSLAELVSRLIGEEVAMTIIERTASPTRKPDPSVPQQRTEP